MKLKHCVFIASLALVTTGESAQAQLIAATWDASGRFAHKANLEPGKFIEVCEKLTQGTKVAWHFQSAAPLNFNIHYHEGKDVKYPTKRDASAGARGRLDAALEQDYCWMWTNPQQKTTALRLTLKRK
jgi:hypothetical protein